MSLKMKKRLKDLIASKVLFVSALSFAMIVIVVSVVGYSYYTHAATASLFSKKLTNPADVMAGGVEGKVDLHLKNVDTIAIVNKNKMAAYFSTTLDPNHKGFKISSNIKLKITKGRDAGACKIPARADGNIEIRIAGEVVFSKPVTQTCSQLIGKTVSFPNGVPPIKRDNDTGYFKVPIQIGFTGHSIAPDKMGGDTDGYSLNYTMELLDSFGAKSKLALVGKTSSQDFGFRSSYKLNPPANRQVKASVVFGFPCTVDPLKLDRENRKVKLYDPDPVFGITYMWIEKNNHPIDKNDYDTGLSNNIKAGSWDNVQKRWTVDAGNQDTAILALSTKKGVIDGKSEYRLVILDTGKKGDGSNSDATPHRNTLSMSIPFDSIYGDPKCNYKLKPTVDPPKEQNQTVSVGAKVPFQGHITVTDGIDTDKHDWMLSSHVFDGAPPSLGGDGASSKNPCEWRQGINCKPEALGNSNFKDDTFNTDTLQYDTSGLQAGDSVCFVMSVKKPTYNSPNSRWYHSNMKCVRIVGNDDGTTVTPNTYSYYPKLTATTVIKNDQNYPKIDDFFGYKFNRNKYTWKQLEAKYKARPSSIAISNTGDCSTIIAKGGSNLLDGSCTTTASGNNLFPEPGDPDPIIRSSKQKGPDPIGTWTCYTFAYRRNPPPSQQLKAKIRQYVRDYNDANHDSSDPHWSDDYWVELVPVYNSDGTFSHYDHVIHGAQIKFRDVYDPYDKASPYWDPPKFKFTPFKQASCSIAGIDPKIQIRSNDLKVVGDITTFVRTMEVGSARGSYGSSGEYGVLSGGNNFGMASGSGLLHDANSPDQSAWSPLTFTNNNLSSGYGNFNGVPDPNPPTDANADASYGDGTQFGGVTYPAGMKKVLRINGTLKINGDLKYPDTILSRIGEIPRIIIIADNIEIAPGVKRIDPWLVATNSISTCGPPRGEDWNMSSGDALASADLSTGECNNPLIFNGPVYTTNIYLYRTGGSRVQEGDITNESWYNPDKVMHIDPNVYCKNGDEENCDNTREALSAPAEVFNLRPDAFLSSFSGIDIRNPVATTDKITELPPRF